MNIIYIFTIINTIFILEIHTAELSSTCIPSLTRPGRPLPCSSNLDCECFNLATNNTGICASALISCLSLNRCDLNDSKACSIANTVCVVGSRCNQPVCYPLPLASPLICPRNSIVIPSVSSRTLSSTISKTTPYRIKTTYTIPGTFETVTLYGVKFAAKLVQLFESTVTPYIEILNTTIAPSPISINNATQTLTLSSLNDLNIILYFKILKNVIYEEFSNEFSSIDIENVNSTNITLGNRVNVTITGTNQLNVYPGCCGFTNISSLGTINVTLADGEQTNVTAIGENVYIQGTHDLFSHISMKAKNNATIATSGIITCHVEAGNFININLTGISAIYGQSSSSTLSVNMTLKGLSTVYMGVSDKNGTKIGYACPKTVDLNISEASKVYVCATNKINVNGSGGNIHYQGTLIDNRTHGNKIPF